MKNKMKMRCRKQKSVLERKRERSFGEEEEGRKAYDYSIGEEIMV